MLEWEMVQTFFLAHYDAFKDFAGPIVASVIAFFGFRSFRRWKREQLEGRRMEIAFEALKLAYQSTYVFDNIRSPLIEAYEWADMPQNTGDNEDKRSRRGPFYAVSKRIQANKEFFKSVWDVQPACMAIFGAEIQDTFIELHKARRAVEVACQMLYNHVDDVPLVPDPQKSLWQQLRADICGAEGVLTKEGDRVGRRLTAFKDGIERVCQPAVKHRIGKRRRPWRKASGAPPRGG
jgi:hypothetical protein